MSQEPSLLHLHDPLAHRALEALMRADATVTRRLSVDLERAGVSATGFAILTLLTVAGGELELRAIRRRLRVSKATATEVLDTMEGRGYVRRRRLRHDRRAVAVLLTETGRDLVTENFPEHAARVESAFNVLDEDEKRQLAQICRKLAEAA